MNEQDSERMLRILEGYDYSETKEAKEADLVLINTCSVREKPEHKVYSALGRFKELKEEKATIIGVAGCVAQQEGERLFRPDTLSGYGHWNACHPSTSEIASKSRSLRAKGL